MFTIYNVPAIRDTPGVESQNANTERNNEKNNGVGSSGKTQHELAADFR